VFRGAGDGKLPGQERLADRHDLVPAADGGLGELPGLLVVPQHAGLDRHAAQGDGVGSLVAVLGGQLQCDAIVPLAQAVKLVIEAHEGTQVRYLGGGGQQPAADGRPCPRSQLRRQVGGQVKGRGTTHLAAAERRLRCSEHPGQALGRHDVGGRHRRSGTAGSRPPGARVRPSGDRQPGQAVGGLRGGRCPGGGLRASQGRQRRHHVIIRELAGRLDLGRP